MIQISKVTRRYTLEFLFRFAVFLMIVRVYLVCPDRLDFTAGLFWPLVLLWAAVLASMLAQLNENSGLTTGCLKQYPNHFDPVPGFDHRKLRQAVCQQDHGAVKVAVAWLAVNTCLGLFYHLKMLKTSFMVLLCAFYYLCDLICVLFFCPFQHVLMHNRCCVNCRIFAWGSWMMATPFLYIPHWYSWTLFGAGMLVLCVWEIRYRHYPERFWDGSNRNLQCGSCQEQLCRYKRLQSGTPK